MSSDHPVRSCPRCGTKVTRTGGLTRKDAAHLAHGSLHTLPHVGPISLLVCVGAAAIAALTPKSYTCGNCRHEFRD